ncbi:MAG: FecR family protein [Casimicrobiaceae bacterium]
MLRLSRLTPFVVFALACASGGAWSADVVVGSVVAVRGAVSIESGGAQQPALAKAAVRLGDSIVTTAGKAQIALKDGTIISVGENSRMRVADYDTSGSGIKARVGLIAGALRLVVAKVTPSGKFEVETETAVAAVRGTDWLVEAVPGKTAVAIVNGSVAVTGRALQSRTTVVLDAPGQGTDVPRDGPPTPVTVWGAQRFSSLLARASFE